MFDRDAVVETAMMTFWAKGVSETTLPDLERATGTDRSTIYNSFDGKRGLHELAVREYIHRLDTQLLEPMRDGSAGIDDVIGFLDAFEAMMTSTAAGIGCLIVNDFGSADRDVEVSEQYLPAVEAAVGKALRRAVELGEIDADDAEPLVGVVAAALVGVNVINRGLGCDAAAARIRSVRDLLSLCHRRV